MYWGLCSHMNCRVFRLVAPSSPCTQHGDECRYRAVNVDFRKTFSRCTTAKTWPLFRVRFAYPVFESSIHTCLAPPLWLLQSRAFLHTFLFWKEVTWIVQKRKFLSPFTFDSYASSSSCRRSGRKRKIINFALVWNLAFFLAKKRRVDSTFVFLSCWQHGKRFQGTGVHSCEIMKEIMKGVCTGDSLTGAAMTASLAHLEPISEKSANSQQKNSNCPSFLRLRMFWDAKEGGRVDFVDKQYMIRFVFSVLVWHVLAHASTCTNWSEVVFDSSVHPELLWIAQKEQGLYISTLAIPLCMRRGRAIPELHWVNGLIHGTLPYFPNSKRSGFGLIEQFWSSNCCPAWGQNETLSSRVNCLCGQQCHQATNSFAPQVSGIPPLVCPPPRLAGPFCFQCAPDALRCALLFWFVHQFEEEFVPWPMTSCRMCGLSESC